MDGNIRRKAPTMILSQYQTKLLLGLFDSLSEISSKEALAFTETIPLDTLTELWNVRNELFDATIIAERHSQ